MLLAAWILRRAVTLKLHSRCQRRRSTGNGVAQICVFRMTRLEPEDRSDATVRVSRSLHGGSKKEFGWRRGERQRTTTTAVAASTTMAIVEKGRNCVFTRHELLSDIYIYIYIRLGQTCPASERGWTPSHARGKNRITARERPSISARMQEILKIYEAKVSKGKIMRATLSNGVLYTGFPTRENAVARIRKEDAI